MRSRFLIAITLSDLLALALVVAVSSYLVFGTALPWQADTPGPVWPMLGFLVSSLLVVSLLTQQMSGPGVPRPSYGRMSAVILGTAFLTAGLLVLFRDVYFSRGLLAWTHILWVVPATAHRIVWRRRPWLERIGVITNEKQLADDLDSADHADVVWVLDPASEGEMELPDRDVTIAVDLRALLSDRVAQYLSSCDVAGHAIRPFSSVYEEHTGRVPLVHLAEGWEISSPLLRVVRWMPGKRLFDVLVAGATAVLWLPLGAVIVGYIKLVDPGFSIFRQQRIGLGGEPFTMYKLRTMHLDAEKDGPRFAEEKDPRLIRGGRFLRRARLDEIPQMWNVLRGDMSLVGPRAEQVPFVEEFREQIPFYDQRHLVRPGITGWAQVNHAYADDQADTVDKLSYDLHYIKHMSPVMDIRILWKTVWTVLTGSGSR